MINLPDLRTTARAFIGNAFVALRKENVIPTPIFHPYVAVGRDYFGDTIHGVPEYGELERQLEEDYPERFADPRDRHDPEFASSYIFSFLEACITRCGRSRDFDPGSAGVDESIDELLAVLTTTTSEVVCCRHVSHLTTTSGDEVQIDNVTVVPETQQLRYVSERIQREIPGAATAWNRDDPRPYAPPHALLVVRETSDVNPYEIAKRLSRQLERFLFLARLLSAGTVQSIYQVSGAPTLVSRMNPYMDTFRTGWFGGLVRRTVRLSSEQSAAFAALGGLIDAADVKREGMVATSFDVAVSKFNRSHADDAPYEHLVDLATALEAALIGTVSDTEGVTLRLRTRTAALLATDNDSGRALFDDVGALYSLRSKFVHGGHLRERGLRNTISKISTVPSETLEHRFGLAIGHAVDRMRDVVRRAILARLCLAADPDPLWPFAGETEVDAILADDAQRALWRTRWHERLDELGVGSAGGRPPTAVDAMSQEDR